MGQVRATHKRPLAALLAGHYDHKVGLQEEDDEDTQSGHSESQ